MSADSPLSSPAFRDLLVFQVVFGLAFSVFFLLPKYLTTSLASDASGVGMVMGTYSIGALVITPAIASLERRFGAGWCLWMSSLTLALASLLFLLVNCVGPLVITARLLQGAACTMAFAVGSVVAAGLVAPERMTSAIALFISSGLVTIAIGPAVAEWLIAHTDARVVFVTSTLLAVAAVWPVRNLIRHAPHLTLPNVSRHLATGEGTSSPRFNTDPGFTALLGAALVFGLTAGAMFTFYQPLALKRGISPVSGFLVAFTLTATGVRLLGGDLMDRVGARRLAWISLIAYALVTAGMALLRPGLLEVLGILFGLTHGLFFPSLIAVTMAGDPVQRTGRSAWMNGVLNIGGLGVIPLGAVAGSQGYALIFVVLGGANLLAAFALVFALRPRTVAVDEATPSTAHATLVALPGEGACPALD